MPAESCHFLSCRRLRRALIPHSSVCQDGSGWCRLRCDWRDPPTLWLSASPGQGLGSGLCWELPLACPGSSGFPAKSHETPPDDAELASRRNEGSWMSYELMMRSSADDGSLISDFLGIRCTCGNCVITKQWAPVHLQVVLVSPNPGLMWVSGERAPAGLMPKLKLQPSL